jgi:hypothetical protein
MICIPGFNGATALTVRNNDQSSETYMLSLSLSLWNGVKQALKDFVLALTYFKTIGRS